MMYDVLHEYYRQTLIQAGAGLMAIAEETGMADLLRKMQDR